MKKHKNKDQDFKRPASIHEATSKQGRGVSQLMNQQPETTEAQTLKAMVNRSPQVQQMQSFQAMANNSPQVKEAAQLKQMADSVVQRIRVQDSRDGRFYETDDMEPQEIKGLALQFYQLHNIEELRRLQEAHGDLGISDGELYDLAYGEPHPRTRKRHHLSDGESDNEDMDVAYRSLREDEDPLAEGLLPPADHDPSISARAHITAGTKAKKKSKYISGTRSKKVSGAWASKNKGGRVARFEIPRHQEHYDLTRPTDQDRVFPSGSGSSLNTAKASQEVLVADRIPPEYIQSLYEAEPLSVREYDDRRAAGAADQELFRSRTTTASRPAPFALHEVYNREEASAGRLEIARILGRSNQQRH